MNQSFVLVFCYPTNETRETHYYPGMTEQIKHASSLPNVNNKIDRKVTKNWPVPADRGIE